MATQYTVKIWDASTNQETTSEPSASDKAAIDFAEREAERLSEHLEGKGDSETRFEQDGWGRYLVWLSTSDTTEEVAYVVTVEEEEVDADD